MAGVSPSVQDALQKLRETEGMLVKKSQYLKKRIQNESKLIKQHGRQNKIRMSIWLSHGVVEVSMVAFSE